MKTALASLAILLALASGGMLGYVGYQTLTAEAEQSDMADELAEMGLEAADLPPVEPAPSPASAFGFLAGAIDALLGIALALSRRRLIAGALFVLGGASAGAIAFATGATTGAAFFGLASAGVLAVAGILMLLARPGADA
jgi:hypothetical protein